MSADNMSDETQCRICLEYVNYNKYPEVFRPCACNTYIHRDCLHRQISYTHQDCCEVCRKKYIFNLYMDKKFLPFQLKKNDKLSEFTLLIGLYGLSLMIGPICILFFFGLVLKCIKMITHKIKSNKIITLSIGFILTVLFLFFS